jgi:Ca2+-binding EF-hand superfamily protein
MMPPPAPPAEADLHRTLETFARYDTYGRGFLSPGELGELLSDMQYDADESYLLELCSTFGTTEGDGGGPCVPLAAFEVLFDSLGGLERLQSPGAGEAGQVTAEVMEHFYACDYGDKGYLDRLDMAATLREMGHWGDDVEEDEEELQALLERFGNWGMGALGQEEWQVTLPGFEKMWVHLLPQETAAAAGGDNHGADENGGGSGLDAYVGDVMQVFQIYDSTGSGHLTRSELSQLLTDMHYKFDATYVDGLIQSFGADSDENGEEGSIMAFSFDPLFEALGGFAQLTQAAAESAAAVRIQVGAAPVSRAALAPVPARVRRPACMHACLPAYSDGGGWEEGGWEGPTPPCVVVVVVLDVAARWPPLPADLWICVLDNVGGASSPRQAAHRGRQARAAGRQGAPRGAAAAAARVMPSFEDADTDGDGVLSPSEYAAAMAIAYSSPEATGGVSAAAAAVSDSDSEEDVPPPPTVPASPGSGSPPRPTTSQAAPRSAGSLTLRPASAGAGASDAPTPRTVGLRVARTASLGPVYTVMMRRSAADGGFGLGLDTQQPPPPPLSSPRDGAVAPPAAAGQTVLVKQLTPQG